MRSRYREEGPTWMVKAEVMQGSVLPVIQKEELATKTTAIVALRSVSFCDVLAE